MSDSNPSPKANFWRKALLVCACVCFLRTLIPVRSHIGDLWLAIADDFVFELSLSFIASMNLKLRVYETILSCLTISYFTLSLLVPVFTVVLTAKFCSTSNPPDILARTLSYFLFGAFAVLPSVSLIKLLYAAQNPAYHAHRNPEVFADVFFFMLLIHFAFIALFLLLWKDRRRTALEVPVLLALPALGMMLYWSSVLTFQMMAGTPLLRVIKTVVPALASVVMLFSLYKYTRAVRAQPPPDSPLRHS